MNSTIESDEERNQLLMESSLAFFGAITASVTHELNNVLAIIEQNAGLLDDMCAGIAYGNPIKPEKVQEISEKIVRQVERGTGLTKRLNYFAHNVDEPYCTFELNALIQNLLDLCQRFAFMKKITLEGKLPEYPVKINSKPFIVEQAIYICLRLLMAAAKPDEIIKVELEPQADKVSITISGATVKDDDVKSQNDLIALLLEQVQGTLQITNDTCRGIFRLIVPGVTKEA